MEKTKFNRCSPNSIIVDACKSPIREQLICTPFTT